MGEIEADAFSALCSCGSNVWMLLDIAGGT